MGRKGYLENQKTKGSKSKIRKNKFVPLKIVTDALEWKNIDHEIYRVYVFPGKDKMKVKRPILINISQSGGHRIVDYKNVSHYIPPKWVHFYFETNDNVAWRF